ncbi:alpha/beta fold hydrolase [Paenactinomyces guangxiensis]|uniref:Alpha/beta fold hydrolase n=1 Tax=Paenactinomyces guangxiensis TaxID=1490290 RepID=A0A7W1WSD9_9BACL|nr:alpha/beta fold hydrolase [Paenactinomyces guangxiensis]MBA4495171.1 alpha/beta fold hydrolase [Paenactinomyces guangxiensis]MBH8592145.1 alpha/beta fold hydrolase [Paenactinomyces guangxiensis]
MPFFCVHPVGGNAFSYIHLADALGMDQPFYCLQAQGLEDDVPPIEDVQTMALHYMKYLLGKQEEPPYVLGGYSFGGIVALEMARELRHRGLETLLVLIDAICPSVIANKKTYLSEEVLLNEFAKELMIRAGKTLKRKWVEKLGTDTPEQAIERMRRELIEANVLKPDIGYQQLWRYYQVLKFNTLAFNQYHSKPYHGKVILIRAEEQLLKEMKDKEMLGWEETLSDLTVFRVPGNHFTCLFPPHVNDVAALLKDTLKV